MALIEFEGRIRLEVDKTIFISVLKPRVRAAVTVQGQLQNEILKSQNIEWAPTKKELCSALCGKWTFINDVTQI